MAGLEALSEWADGLLASLEEGQRKQLAQLLAVELRRRNQARIAAQVDPDDAPYAPRKTQARAKQGAIRRRMFSRLRTNRFLKAIGTPDEALVEFSAQVQRIAQIHHEGLRDRVSRRSQREVKYPARELIGLPDKDIDLISDLVLSWLG